MKKFSVCVVLSLVVCLIMAFPAGATTVTKWDGLDSIIKQIDDYCVPKLPAGYNYRMVFSGYKALGYNNHIFIVYTNTPVLAQGSSYYQTSWFGISLNNPSLINLYKADLNLVSNPRLDFFSTSTNLGMSSYYMIENYSTASFYNRDTLLLAADFMVYVLPDTVELEELLIVADDIEDIGYTAITWNRFSAARSDGHALLSRSSYTESEVTGATTELRVSMDSLALKAVDPPPVVKPSAFDPNGRDLGNGQIMGFLNPSYDIFVGYVVSLYPVLIGFFSILFGIKLIPVIVKRIFSVFRR